MTKLKKKLIPRKKSLRPVETKGIGLERISRGKITAANENLFQVKLSGNRYQLFRKEDSIEYNKPEIKIEVRCVYHGRKDSTFPYAVYDMNWNKLYLER